MNNLRTLVLRVVLLFGLAITLTARAASAVEQWDVFELTLRGPREGNPFVDVRVSAVFTNGTRTLEAAGFYDGDGVYRVRFMPEAAGRWRYETKAIVGSSRERRVISR